MDANKLKVLEEIDYKILPCCMNCKHADIYVLGFGTCKLHTYQHLKHENPGGSRGLSIHASGTCQDFDPAEFLHDGWIKFKEWDE